MSDAILLGPSAHDSDFEDLDIEKLLEQLDGYIVTLARKKVPRNIIRPELVEDEIEELAQKIRIKLWMKLQKEPITSPKAYISRIAYTEAVDLVRQYNWLLPLTIDEDGELYHGNLLLTPSEGMQNPADELEHEETFIDFLERAVREVLALPPCQRYALLCSLKDHREDILPLVEALKDQGVDIETTSWPDGKEGMQRFRSSLSIARKKLRPLRGACVLV